MSQVSVSPEPGLTCETGESQRATTNHFMLIYLHDIMQFHD